MLDPIAPTKALLSMYGCQINVVEGTNKKTGTFYHDAHVTSLKTHFGPVCLTMSAGEGEKK